MAGVQSIERAFAVLRVLARGEAGVTEIAERTELPKSTVSRLLSALEQEGAAVQNETGGGYSIGPALATLGAVGPKANVRSTVRPFIEELALLTGGSSGYTLRDGDSAFWVDNVDDGDELVLVADQTGQAFPLHTVASGLAVLAKLSVDDLDGYIDRMAETELDHDASGAAPFSEPAALRRRLERVRVDGVVASREDLHPGVNAFAAAFQVPGGDWDGAIYVQGPSFRFPEVGDEQRVVKLVAEFALQLSDLLVGR